MTARTATRQHLDAGQHLHPMTLIDLFYFILEHHGDLIEAWDRSRHQLWCACGDTPQPYAHASHLRPILCRVEPNVVRQDREIADELRAEARQMSLDFDGDDDLIADEDIPF